MTLPLLGIPIAGQRFRFAGGAHDAFSRELRRLAAPILADPQRQRRGRRLLHAKATAWAAVLAASYGALLAAPTSGWACLALAAIAAFAALMLAISAGHDAAHGAFFASPRANRALTIATFGLLGVDGNLWQRRHNGSHHAFPNVSGCDVDIDQNPVIRLSPHHARRPWQRWQHFYAPLAYALVQLHSIMVGDAIYLFRRRVANIIRERPSWSDAAIFAGTKVTYALLALGLPMAALARPWWHVACGWLAISTLTSLTFVVLLIGTHFVEASTHPLAAADGAIAGSWARHQLATSLDWHPESRLANALSGGANAHAAHHLFPRVPHVHYVALTPIIRAAARRHGVPYNRASFAGMIGSHFRFLRKLSGASKRQDAPKVAPNRARTPLSATLAICCALLGACGKYPSRTIIATPASPLADPLVAMRDIAVRSGAVHEEAIDPTVNPRLFFGETIGYAWAEAVYCPQPDCRVLVTLLVGAGTGKLIFWVIEKRLTRDLQRDGLDLFERIDAEARHRFGADRVHIIMN